MSIKVQVLKARKILVGAVGVATLSFLAGCRSAVSNLMAAPSCDVAPKAPYCIGPPAPDSGTDMHKDAPLDTGSDAHDALGDDASDATRAVTDAAIETNDGETDALVDATDATVD